MKKFLVLIAFVFVITSNEDYGQTNTNIFPLTGPVGIGTLTLNPEFQLTLFDPPITADPLFRNSGIELINNGSSLDIGSNSHLSLVGRSNVVFRQLTNLTTTSGTDASLILHSGIKIGDIIITNRHQKASIRFATTSENNANDYERMRINNIGHVGIGNQDPKELLHIGDKMTFHSEANNNYIGNNVYSPDRETLKRVDKGYAEMIMMSNLHGLMTLTVDGWNDNTSNIDFGTTTESPLKGISIYHRDKSENGEIQNYAQVTIGNIWPLHQNARFSIRSIGNNEKTYAMLLQNADERNIFVVNDAGLVGINTISPQAELDVAGNSIIEGNSSIWGSLSANGNLTISGTGNIIGNTTIGGELNVSEITSPTLASATNRQVLQLPQEVRIGQYHRTGGLPSGYTNLLSVDGLVVAKEVNVTILDWADYVFGDDYQLKSIDELDAFIQANKHLPGIPKTDEVKANGVDLGQFQAKMLEKLEEMSLYIIQLKKQNDELKSEIDKIKESK